MIFRLAYRNIWRNKRRTLITAASILFAVFFAVTMRAIQKGGWQNMVDSVVHFYFGYAQIHSNGYWDEQSIDKSIAFTPELNQTLSDVKGVGKVVPRLESFVLAAHESQSRGALLIGVDPEIEDKLTGLKSRVESGHYLNGSGALLAKGLAEYLKLNVGDTVVFVSQGYHGVSAAGKYEVLGTVSFPAMGLEDQIAFLSLSEAQEFYGAEGRVTSIVIDPQNPDQLKATTAAVRSKLDDTYEVMDYEEMIPELLEAKGLDEAGGYIMLFILYAIVGFGIFGTLLMMLKERQYEFGILKSIGMKSRELQIMLWLEFVILGLIGCGAGMLLALPIVLYLKANPIRFTGDMAAAYEKFGVEAIIPAVSDPSIFFSQALIVFLMISVMAIYPLIQLKRLQPVKAMREQG